MPLESIQIAVRIRPKNKRESLQNSIISVQAPTITIIPIQKATQTNFYPEIPQQKTFTFHKVYDSQNSDYLSNNISLYNDFGRQLVENVFDGYNSTMFAYGQTGSGKTYTIEGYQQQEGLLQQALKDIFNEKEKRINSDIKILVSYLEIYNEELRDLLNIEKKQMKIIQTSQGVQVQGLSRRYCQQVSECMTLLNEGKKLRVVGSHSMNARSSRSHAIFMVLVIQKNKSQVKVAQLNMVDLAGSERQSKTQSEEQYFQLSMRLYESSNINRSLTFLGLVIDNLILNQNKGQNLHVPYRNSQLTYLLSDSLGGNSKTFMIATISGSEENYEETLSTLRFAERVATIKTNSIQNIEDQEVQKNQNLLQEILNLKKKINELKSSQQTTFNKQDDKEVEQLYELQLSLEDQLEYNELLLMDANTLLQQERIQLQNLEENKASLLKNAGIHLASNKIFDKYSPYLMNISEDPSLTGCLIFYLKLGENSIGHNTNNDIIIESLGIRKRHCIINNENQNKLSIMNLDDENRVLVNGIPQPSKSFQPLQHLDRIYIGYDQAFKVIIPKLNQNKTNFWQDQPHQEENLKGRLNQQNEQSKNLKKTIDDLKSKMSLSQFNIFLISLQTALDNIDKVNEISLFRYRKFPLKSHNIYFSLYLNTSVLSSTPFQISICVQMIHRDTKQVLAIWNLDRFNERLDHMVQWYAHENQTQQDIECLNPWEIGPYKKDLHKLTPKELYKYYYIKLRIISDKIEKCKNEKNLILNSVQQRMVNECKRNISEQELEEFADVFIRNQEIQSDRIQFYKQVQELKGVDIMAKAFVECQAELHNNYVIKQQTEGQIEKILALHKKKQSSQKKTDNIKEQQNIQQSLEIQQKKMIQELEIQNKQLKLTLQSLMG